MDKKIRILVVPSDKYGVGYFRSRQPHIKIQENYPQYFDVDIIMLQDWPKDIPTDQFLKQYDIIHIHKQLDKNLQLINMCKFLGLKVFVDVDDHWDLGNNHPMSLSARKEKWWIPITEHLKAADYVTTTTPIFANVIKKYNKNVVVFPNAINTEEEQFIPKPTSSNRMRFGFICGSAHLNDFKLIDGIAKQLPKEYLDKMQFVLCGFDTNGTRTIYYQKENRTEQRPIEPKESVWYEYEKIVTDNYRIVSEEHKKFLEMFIPQSQFPNLDEPYRRIWTKNINNYATHYNDIDVLIAPLKECDFNLVKSQLKVIEAGFFHKAFIGQDFGPYQIDINPYIKRGGVIDETGNGLLVESSKNHKQWAKYIKFCIDNPDAVKKMSENLYNTVKDKYNANTVARDRAQMYLDVMGVTDVKLD